MVIDPKMESNPLPRILVRKIQSDPREAEANENFPWV
jgi:hypothetical protein